jgi:hypothetical protein
MSRRKYGETGPVGIHLVIFHYFPNNIELLPKRGWKVSEINTYGTMDPYLLYWMSEMETKGITWDKNMEDEFWEFMLGMLQFIKKWRKSRSSLGYDNNCNSTITCFKSPKGLFLPSTT